MFPSPKTVNRFLMFLLPKKMCHFIFLVGENGRFMSLCVDFGVIICSALFCLIFNVTYLIVKYLTNFYVCFC